MTVIGRNGEKIEFASSVSDKPEQNRLNLATALSEKAKATLMSLPYFKKLDTSDLITEAQGLMRGKVISDRFTAMLIIVGAKQLTDPVFQRQREVIDLGKPRYAKQ
jgi:hypothetical protein